METNEKKLWQQTISIFLTALQLNFRTTATSYELWIVRYYCLYWLLYITSSVLLVVTINVALQQNEIIPRDYVYLHHQLGSRFGLIVNHQYESISGRHCISTPNFNYTEAKGENKSAIFKESRKEKMQDMPWPRIRHWYGSAWGCIRNDGSAMGSYDRCSNGIFAKGSVGNPRRWCKYRSSNVMEGL